MALRNIYEATAGALAEIFGFDGTGKMRRLVPGTGDGGKLLAVNNTEDGFELVAAAENPLPAITSGDAGKALIVNPGEDGYLWGELPSPLPAYGVGDAGKVLAVNGTEDGVEWVTPSGGGGGLPTSPSMDPENYLLGLDGSGDAQWINRYSLNGLYVSGAITSGVTLTAGHINTLLWMNTASGDLTVTLPNNTTEALEIGHTTVILNSGSNQVLVAGEGGVTIYCAAVAASRAQYSILSVTKIATNVWVLTGDLEAV